MKNLYRNKTLVILFVGAIYICLTMGVRQSFGLYLKPFTGELGVMGVGAFSLAVGLQNIAWGLASPFFGIFADRRGPVMAVASGGALYVAGLLLMASATSGSGVVIGQLLIGVGIGGAGFSVILGMVGKVAPAKHRSTVLAVVTAAGSFGQFALVPLAQQLILSFGVRESLYGLAMIAIFMVILAPLLKLPENAPRATHNNRAPLALKQALSLRSYMLLTVGFFVCGFQLVFIATHLPQYVADNGISDQAAAWALSMVGLFNIIGTLACGWLGDKFPKKNVLSLFYLARSAVIILFLVIPISSTSVVVFGALIGLFWLGTVPLTSGLISVFFGVRYLSMLYGVTFLMHQLGSSLGAWMGGWFYSLWGNYDMMWTIAILLGFVAALLHYPIKEREDERFIRQFA